MARRIGESGNIFFTLFGAVALVGVIGVATSNLMRGPVGTVMKLNQIAKAESQLQIARKMTALEAAQQSNTDCDDDGFLEPLPPEVGDAGCTPGDLGLTGGGCIDNNVGVSKVDPWGTRVGYCAWDHGPVIGDMGCSADFLSGTNGSSETVIAVISAGPDRTFGHACQNDPDYVKVDPPSNPAASDDIVLTWTYDDAIQGAGGLWALKSGDPDTAQTVDGRNIEVGGDASFQSGASFASDVGFTGAGARLDFGVSPSEAALLILPNQNELSVCNSANDEALRIDLSVGMVLQICDFNGAGDWIDIGGSGSASAVYGADGDVQFNSGDTLYAADNFNYDVVNNRLRIGGSTVADDTLEVTGTADFSGDVEADNFEAVSGTSASDVGLSFNSAGDLGIYGLGSTVGLSVGGTTRFVANNTGAIVTGTFSAGDTTIQNTTINGTLDVTGDISDSGGPVVVNDDLVVNNSLEVGTNFAADAFILGTLSQNEGLYSDGSDGLELRTQGGSRLTIDSAGVMSLNGTRVDADGDIGIALGGPPTTDLDIGGSLRLRTDSGATAGGVCALGGSIAYTSGDELLICSDITNNWETIGTSGGGGGGSGGIWERTSGVIRIKPDDFSNTDDFVVGSLQLNDETSGNEDERMFFENSTGAFRAGIANGTEWDTRGNYSVAMGLNTQATADGTFAVGNNAQARATDALALGRDVTVAAGALQSMGLGLGIAAGADPQITATESLGIFMQDQSGVTFAANNTLGLFGGNLLIDPNEPATELATSGALTVDVEGDVGAIQFCSEDGTFCFTAEDVATGSTGAPGNDREMVFNSAGSLATDTNLVFTSAGRLGIGTTTPSDSMHVYNSGGDASIKIEGNDQDAAILRLTENDTSGDDYGGLLKYDGSTNTFEIGTLQGNTEVPAMYIPRNTADVGINTSSPQTNLDVDGTIKMAYGGEACDASRQGAIHFDSAGEDFYVCQDGVSWQRVITTGGGAGTPAGGSDREVQFNSGGDLAGNPNFVFTSAGRMGIGTGAPSQTFDVSGTANVTGATTLGSTLGVTGQVDFSSGLNVTSATNLSDALDVTGATTLGSTLDVTSATTLGSSLDTTGQVNFSSGLNVTLATNLSDVLDVTGAATFGSTLDVTGATTLDGLFTTTANSNLGGLVTFTSSGAVVLPTGTTGEQPTSPSNGMIRYNTDNDKFEAYQGGTWEDIITSAIGGGAADPDRGIQFKSGEGFAAVSDFVYTSAGDMGLGIGAPAGRLQVEGGDIIFLSNGGGNVGIGMASPVAKLHVNGKIQIGDKGYDSNEDAYAAIADLDIYNPAGASIYLGSVGAGTDSAIYFGEGLGHDDKPGIKKVAIISEDTDSFFRQKLHFALEGDTSASRNVDIDDSRLMIHYNGNVGVGTVEPDTLLDVDGTIKMAYGGEACDASRQGAIHFDSAGEDFYVCQDGADWQRIITAGGSGGGLPAAGSDTQIQYNSGNELWAATNFVYTSAGQLGLGKASPSYMLDVAGASNIDGAVTLGSSLDATGQVNFSSGLNVTLATNLSDVLDVAGATTLDGLFTTTADSNLGGLVTFTSSGAVVLPSGTTGEQPDVASNGMIRYNTDNDRFEAYQGGTWEDIITSAIGGGAADPDRGIQFKSGANFAADANFIYTSAGQLGLGIAASGVDVSTPQSDFHIARSGSDAGIHISAEDGTYDPYISFLNGYVTATDDWSIGMDDSNSDAFAISGDASLGTDTKFTILPTGEVGIGTETPVFDVHVHNSSDNNVGMRFTNGNSGALDSDGFAIGLDMGTASDGGFVWVRETLPLKFGTDDTEQMRLTSAGRLSVGTTAPDTLLDVDGTIKMAYGGEACDAAREGAVRFDSSTNSFSFCADLNNDWESITLGSGTLAALGDTNITTPATGEILYYSGSEWVNNTLSADDVTAPGTDRQMIFNSGGNFAASGNLEFTENDLGGGWINRSIVMNHGYQGGLNLNMDDNINGLSELGLNSDGDNRWAITRWADSYGNADLQNAFTIRQYRDKANSNVNVDRLVINDAGLMGVGTNAPDTLLDAAGTIKMAYGGEACDAAREGAIRFDSATNSFSFCADLNNDWESITLGSGTLAALGDTNITTPATGELLYYSGSEWVNNTLSADDVTAPGTDRQIIFNSAGAFATGTNFVFTSAGRLGIGTSSPDAELSVVGRIRTDANNMDGHRIGRLQVDYHSSSNPRLRSDGNTIYIDDTIVLTGETDNIFAMDAGRTSDLYIGHRRDGDYGVVIQTDTDSGVGTERFRIGGGNSATAWFDNITGVGIGTTAPVASLDIAGDIRFASSSLACNVAGHEGAMQYGSGGSNIFEVCANSTNGWEQLALGGTVVGALDDLSDVDTTGFADGDVLLYSAGLGSWAPGDAPLVGVFTDLTDTPADYSGQGSKFLRVNSGATAVEFTDQIIESVSGEPAPTGLVLNDLGDVSASGPSADEFLTWNGTSWVASAIGNAGGLWTAGTGDDIYYNSGTPQVGIGTTAPDTLLDAAGTIKMAYGGEACDAAREGAIRFDSGTNSFSFCADLNNDWESITLGSGSLAALSDTNITTPATGELLYYSGGEWVNNALSVADIASTGTDREIFFRSGNQLTTDTGYVYTSAGRLGLGTASPAGMLHVSGGDVLIDNTRALRFQVHNDPNEYTEVATITAAGEVMLGGHFGGMSDVSVFGTEDVQINIDSNGNQNSRTFTINKDARINGTELFRVQENGLVGVGNAAPVATLDIAGDIKFASSSLACNVAGHEGAMQYGSGGSNIFEVCANSATGWEQLALGGTVAGALDDLSDVSSASAADSEVLYYSGGNWINNALSADDVTAPGADRQMIFNSGGSFAADAGLTYSSAGHLGLGGNIYFSSGILLGDSAMTTTGEGSHIVIGKGSQAGNSGSGGGPGYVVIGDGASATGNDTSTLYGLVAIGRGASSRDTGSVAIGNNASANGLSNLAIGDGASASSAYSTAIGGGSSATNRATAVGKNANASGNYSVALGRESNAGGAYATALGKEAIANNDHSLAIGHGATTTAVHQLMIGSASGTSSINEAYIGANATNAYPLLYANLTGVGIGTTAPVASLDIAGDIKFASSSLACNVAGHEGAMQYGSGGSNIFEVCANSASGWEQLALGGTVAGALNDLSDVNTTGFADGEVLTYSAGASGWVPAVTAPGLFTDLTDVPASYSGQGGKLLAVNSTPDGVEFVDPNTIRIWSDEGGRIGYSNALGGARIAAVSGAASPVGATAGLGGSGGSTALNDLTDVNTTGFADGEVLTYSAGASGWVSLAASGGGGLWTAGTGDDIYYNSGTAMVGIGTTDPAQALDVVGNIRLSSSLMLGSVSGVGTPLSNTPALNDLSDVNTTGFADGEVLTYSAGASGWVSAAASGSSTSPASPLRGIQFNSGGSFEASGDLVFTSVGMLDVTGDINLSSGNAYHYGGVPFLRGVSTSPGEFGVTLLGHRAGENASLISGMTAVGFEAGMNYTDSFSGVTAIGHQAGKGTSGFHGTYLGYEAGERNTGDRTTAVGYEAGKDSTGNELSAFGYLAAVGNAGHYVTAVGRYAGHSNTQNYLTALGYDAGRNNQGWRVTALGYEAGFGNTGDRNSFMGASAGMDNTGSYNVGLGYKAMQSNTYSGSIALGYYTSVTANNQLVIGTGAHTTEGSINEAYIGLNATNAYPLIYANLTGVGIGTTTPRTSLDLGNMTDALVLPAGLDGDRPAGVAGMIRYNSTSNEFEGYTASTWTPFSTGTVAAASPLRGIQFNSGGSFTADSNLVFTSAGDLGLGTASPAGMLHVSGGDILLDNNQALRIQTQDDPNTYLEVVKFNSAGDLFVGQNWNSGQVTSLYGAGNVEINLDSNDNDADDRVFSVRKNAISGGTELFRVQENGRVGIGTDNPDEKLEIKAANPDLRLSFDSGTPSGDAGLKFSDNAGNVLGYVGYNIDNESLILETDDDGDGTGRIQFQANNALRMIIDTDGGVAIGGDYTPDTMLEVDGAIKMAYGGEACDSQREGAIHYDSSTDKFMGCSTAGSWTELGGSGGASAASPDRGIQFNSGGVFFASAGLQYTADGDFLVQGTHTGTASVPASGVGTRMFFEPQTSAFRAGHADGTEWDNVNIGSYSVGMGDSAIASGSGSVSMGRNTVASGARAVALGHYTEATGNYSVAMGNASTANGIYGIAMGYNTRADGNASIALGRDVDIPDAGDGSMAIALNWTGTPATLPQVSGAESLGIFMGDQSGVNLSQARTMALMGGKFGIGTVAPGYDLDILNTSGTAQLHISGDGGGPGTADAGIYLDRADEDNWEIEFIDGQLRFAHWENTGATYSQVMFMSAAGYVGIGNSSPDVELDVTGDIEYTGTITDVSDRRLKTDITPLDARGSMLERIGQVDTYSFRMKDDDKGRTEFGVMAQELERVFPELVKTANDERGTKSVNYVGLIAPMIEASKELQAENDTLRAELAAMKAQQEDILADVKGLKAHTGYGIGKAQIGLWMLVGIGGGMIIMLLTGGALRRYRSRQNG